MYEKKITKLNDNINVLCSHVYDRFKKIRSSVDNWQSMIKKPLTLFNSNDTHTKIYIYNA